MTDFYTLVMLYLIYTHCLSASTFHVPLCVQEIESIDKQVDNQEAIASEDIDGTPLDVIIPKKDVAPQKSEISDENETGSSDDDSSPPVEPTRE